jgi:nicotinamidase-related amidase
MKLRNSVAVAVTAFVAAAIGLALPAAAASIIDEWTSVKTPPAPALKPVTIEAKTTALLMLDFMNQNCGKRPRCLASIPTMKKLLAEARSKGATVVYSIIANTTTADVIKDVAPAAGEPSVQSGVDKFFKTDLDKILAGKDIKTVIAVGTAAEGAVLYTASGAVLRGMAVVVPVDGMSSVEAFSEQYVAWHLTHAPIISSKVTLTKTDMMKF